MKALILLCIMAIAVPASFLVPYVGILTYIWMAIARPHEWAYVKTAQYSLIVGVATILGYIIFEVTKRPPRIVPNLLMLLVWLQCLLGTYFGVYPESAEPKFIEFTKIIVIGLLISWMVDNESRVRWLLMVTLGSIGTLVLRSFIAIIIHLGNVKIVGPGGNFEDNNDYALLLVMAFPLMYFFAKSEKNKWIKLAFYGQAVMTVVTILFTLSRGGFLGLCMVSFLMAMKTRYKVTGMAVIVLVGALFLAYGPDKVVDRISTIENAQNEDSSAQQRLRAWKVSLGIIRDYPLAGIGSKNILLIYGRYGDPLDARVAHNSYLQCAVDAGIPGLLFFITMIIVTLLRVRKIRSVLKLRSPDNIMINYTQGLEASIMGYCVSAFFLSQYTQEVLYILIPLVVGMKMIAKSYEREGEMQDLVNAAAHRPDARTPLPAYGLR